MSKELDALESIKRTIQQLDYGFISKEDYEDFQIIETTLKNYQELLKRPCVLIGRNQGHTKALIDMISKNYKEIKITNFDDDKKLKALEIIKEYFILTNEYGKVSLEPRKNIPENKLMELKEVLL